LVFVFAGEFVSVAQYDLPLAVFAAVGLGAAQGPGLRLITGVTGHVLQVDGVGEVTPTTVTRFSAARSVALMPTAAQSSRALTWSQPRS
jgi:hypothetical protein